MKERINNINKGILLMSSSLFFKIKDSVNVDKHKILEFFFADWVDNTCEKEVNYSSERRVDERFGIPYYQKTLRVDFDRQEDALAIMLKGIPKEFQSYLEIIKQ